MCSKVNENNNAENVKLQRWILTSPEEFRTSVCEPTSFTLWYLWVAGGAEERRILQLKLLQG